MATRPKPAEPDSPAWEHFAITPSNSDNFRVVTRGIYVGVAGDVAVVSQSDNVVIYKNAVAGSIIPVMAKRVNSTNTTATDLVGLY
jgi:hypothetical protein